MKIIFKLSIVIVFAVIIASCTDEKDFIDNKPSKVNKNMQEGILREFAEYEEVSYDEQQIEEMLTQFNEAINNYNVSMPDMDLKKSLFVMETFFNNAIVTKQTGIANEEIYTTKEFEFTLPIESDIINGDILRDGFRDFVDTILTQMEGYNLNISDIYVKNISGTYVTFTLEMEPCYYLPYMPESYTWGQEVKNVGEQIWVPQGGISSWHTMSDLEPEMMVHRHSFKNRGFGTFTKIRRLGYDKGRFNYCLCFGYLTDNTGDQVIWNSSDLNNNIIPKAIVKVREIFNLWRFPNTNQILINYNPYLIINKDKTNDQTGVNFDEYKLVFSYIIVAEPTSLSFEDIHYVASALIDRPIFN